MSRVYCQSCDKFVLPLSDGRCQWCDSTAFDEDTVECARAEVREAWERVASAINPDARERAEVVLEARLRGLARFVAEDAKAGEAA